MQIRFSKEGKLSLTDWGLHKHQEVKVLKIIHFTRAYSHKNSTSWVFCFTHWLQVEILTLCVHFNSYQHLSLKEEEQLLPILLSETVELERRTEGCICVLTSKMFFSSHFRWDSELRFFLNNCRLFVCSQRKTPQRNELYAIVCCVVWTCICPPESAEGSVCGRKGNVLQQRYLSRQKCINKCTHKLECFSKEAIFN